MREMLAHLKLIIIDEISMVGADMLYKIHMRLKEIFQTDVEQLFANINMVFVGDLMQLPPVKAVMVFKTPKNSELRSGKEVLELWNKFQPMLLKHNHRQGEGKLWVESLNRIREGIVTEQDEILLKTRKTSF